MNKNLKKKLKYGSFAIALTVSVLALVILANAVFTGLSQSKNLYLDMTKEQIFSISSQADAIYSKLSEKDIKIVFFTAPDIIQGSEYQKMVYDYAKLLENKYDYITVEYINSTKDPEAVKKYRKGNSTKIGKSDVVITNGEDFRIFNIEKFFTFDSESGALFAFNGEYRFATALMQLTYKDMIACFTNSHGETTQLSDLYTLFEEAGFSCVTVDLTKDDIPEDARVLIINNPQYDFGGMNDAVNEIAKLDAFVNRSGGYGNIMLFVDPDHVSKLDELNSFIESWGVRFGEGTVKDSAANTIDTEQRHILAQYTADGAASALADEVRALENPPKTIVEDAMPIETLWVTNHNQINVSSLLTSSPEAEVVVGEAVVDKGAKDLVTVSTKLTLGDNYEKYYNYVMVAGTSHFTDEKYLNGNSYGNRDLMYAAMRAFGKEMVPVDLNFKVFDNSSLTVTKAQSDTWTVIFTAVIPGIILAGGVVVWARRRHL